MSKSADIYDTLISASDLAAHISRHDCSRHNWLVVDCRFDLADTGSGEREYLSGHIPGAVYAHLDRDLSDHSRAGMGRHPFPGDGDFSNLLSRWGVQRDTQVVCYDASNGTTAARLWWMLQATGHSAVAVLDGGIAAWRSARGAIEIEVHGRPVKPVQVQFNARRFVGFEEVAALQSSNALMMVDARASPRFCGDVEPLDPVAGHVPGALNRPWTENTLADGRFKTVEQLRVEFDALLHSRSPEAVAHMCGSGVTACHNILAMHHAGLPGARLFAPSWSGWISDASRPIARR